MSDFFKIVYIKILRGICFLFFFLPIKKNRVLFESFSGSLYSCNPKYISEQLNLECKDLEIIWAFRDIQKHQFLENEGIVICKFRSLKHYYYKMTSKVYVSNFLQASEVPKRINQIWIQTWHGGGCYKKLGSSDQQSSKIRLYRQMLQVKETDYFIASSRYFEDTVIHEQLGFQGKVLECGMPRNDILYHPQNQDEIVRLRKKIGVAADAFVVLFAPTWREGLDQYESMDAQKIKAAFEKRFGKTCVMLYRAHLYGKADGNKMQDVTAYEDMQELLYASDCLITDYSSSMWDYSLTRKPCFLFTPDLERYLKLRGFDKDIFTWGFPVCRSNDELVQSIERFSEIDFQDKMQVHQADLESFEQGHATADIVKVIRKVCGV